MACWLFTLLTNRINYFHLLPRAVLLSGLGLAVSCLYVWLAGGEQATLRALFMLFLFCCSRILGARLTSLRSLLLVALVFLSCWPGAWLDMGPQLIFLALFGIGIAVKLSQCITIVSVSLSKVITACLVSFFAWLFTAPVIYIWTGQFSLLQPINNLVVAPLFSLFSISLGLIGLLLIFFDLPGGTLVCKLSIEATELIIYLMERSDILGG